MGSAAGQVIERRRTRRFRVPAEHGILKARVRPGHEASIVDVSSDGVLVETVHRLMPGSAIELRLETANQRAAVGGRVLRCSVARIMASRVWYRGAVGFDRPLSWFAHVNENEYAVLLPESLLVPEP